MNSDGENRKQWLTDISIYNQKRKSCQLLFIHAKSKIKQDFEKSIPHHLTKFINLQMPLQLVIRYCPILRNRQTYHITIPGKQLNMSTLVFHRVSSTKFFLGEQLYCILHSVFVNHNPHYLLLYTFLNLIGLIKLFLY